jgi:UPF0176 protein
VYLNLAGYLFADLTELPQLRQLLHAAGVRLHLTGTVLIAPEGINLFVCAPEMAARQWLSLLRAESRLRTLECKESWSDSVVFERWLVKIKPEIISFRQPGIRPQDRRAASVDAVTLCRWLAQGHDDERRALKLLDTRNEFEVQAGTFEQAEHLAIKSFTDLPRALEQQQTIGKNDRVVTFCTGGIRCEKAALFMAEQGYQHVLQLDGGVLKYFEQVGAQHWRGDLFVFDQRVSVDPTLTPSKRELPEGTVT